MALVKVAIGTQARSLGIPRLNCAEGTKCRAVLLDPNPRVKYMAWDESLRRNVEVDEDLMISYQLKPYTAYFYLVGKLNTDLTGNVVDDKFSIEYMQLSDSINSDFSDSYNEMGGNITSIAISKVSKKTEKGDFSHLIVKGSNYNLSNIPGLLEAVNQISQDPNKLESLWNIVDHASSLTKQQYLELKNGAVLESPKPNKVLPAPTEQVEAIATPVVDDFGEFGSEDFA